MDYFWLDCLLKDLLIVTIVCEVQRETGAVSVLKNKHSPFWGRSAGANKKHVAPMTSTSGHVDK
jgi:hypothetical protein